MLIEISNQTIDLSKVERVGEIGGDPSWLRYTIYFTGGGSLEIYESRKTTPRMPRAEFINLWKKDINNNGILDKQGKHSDTIINIIQDLSTEFDEIHYQSRDTVKYYLQQLLYEISDKDNLVKGITTALEMYLGK